MTAVISPEGEMYFETYSGGTTAGRDRSFLENLNELDESIKFVIHDGLPSDRATDKGICGINRWKTEVVLERWTAVGPSLSGPRKRSDGKKLYG